MALLVKRAYSDVPGVELSASAPAPPAGSQARRFLLAMRDGTIDAEEFIDPGQHGFQLVAGRTGPTFMRASGASCWTALKHSTKRWALGRVDTPAGSLGRLERTDPRSLLNVGYWFPDEGKGLTLPGRNGARRLEIETHDAFWYLAGTANPSQLAPKSFLTITPNPTSHRITSIQVRASERAVRATLTVRPLTTRPAIPQPTPACPRP